MGLEKSHNLMTIRVATDVGLEELARFSEEFGVYDNMRPLLSFALGAGETTLLRLAGSYAMFVNGGKKVKPTLIDRVQDRWGKTVFRHDRRICTECRAPGYFNQEEPYVPEEGEQVISPIVAFQMVSMLEGVTIRGTARSVGRAFDFPVAGKTGTTNQARDAWFVGFTNDLVVGCYIGFDDHAPLGDKMSGGKVCGPVFTEFVKKAVERRKPGPFRRPQGAVMVKIDRNSGCAVESNRKGSDFIWEPFSPEKAPYVGQCPEGGIGGKATTARQAELRRIPQERSALAMMRAGVRCLARGAARGAFWSPMTTIRSVSAAPRRSRAFSDACSAAAASLGATASGRRRRRAKRSSTRRLTGCLAAAAAARRNRVRSNRSMTG